MSGKKPKNTSKFVTTHGRLAWDDKLGRFVTVERDGYWYDGPWALAHDVAPTWEAEDFQFFNDDGSITTATSIAAQNTAVVKTDGIYPGTAVQLKVNVGETAGAAGTGLHTGGWTLQFKKGAGSFTTVGAATDVQYFDSTNLTNGTVIAVANYDLTWGSGGVQRDWGDECEDGVSISQTWSNDYCEICFSIKFHDTNTAEDDVITFRMLAPDGTSAVTFGSVPTITLDAVPAGEDALLADNVESASELTSPVIGQTHAIGAATNVESASELTSPALGQEHTLLADDVESASEVTAPVLLESNILLADDVESASELTSPAITQVQVLLADSVESSSELTSPAIGQIQVLSSTNVESASELTTPAIAEVSILLADNVESASEVSTPAIGQEHVLTATSVESASEVSVPAISSGVGAGVPSAPSGGGFALGTVYDRYREDRQRAEAERKEKRKAVEALDGTDKEIARLLHKQLQREARDEEIATLEAMIQSSYSSNQLQKAKEYNENVARAYAKAASKGGFAAIEQFEREMEKAKEEEDFLLLAIITMS